MGAASTVIDLSPPAGVRGAARDPPASLTLGGSATLTRDESEVAGGVRIFSDLVVATAQQSDGAAAADVVAAIVDEAKQVCLFVA